LEATLTGRFPPPDAALDPYLDAFERAAVRFGVRRVTGTDVAREAGVDRTTVFRNVGTMDDLHREYVTREVHRFISGVVSQIPEGLDGPSTVVEIVAVAIEAATQHPVLSKVLNDEQDYLGQLIPPFLPMILEQVSAALAPGLEMASSVGLIAGVPAESLADWIARFGVTVLVAPPEEPLRELLGEVLIPLLEPRSA
jgi:AcrR family transcriptional regulator